MTRTPEIGSESNDLGLEATQNDMPDIIKGQMIDESKGEVSIDKQTGLVTFGPILEGSRQKLCI